MTVRTYKVIKMLTQLVAVGAGVYAMWLGADPMTTFSLVAFIVSGPEAAELLMTSASTTGTGDQNADSDDRGMVALAGLSGGTSTGLRAWFRDLSYAEVHAAAWGGGLVGAACLATVVWTATTGSLFLAAYLAVLARAVLGQRVRGLLPDRTALKVPKYVVRQVREELHYYLGGGGALAAVGVLTGTLPV